MSERESTLVEITREAPCDGRREALLRLVALPAERPADAETSRHLRGCKRCRAFVESLRLGGRLTRDVFADLEERAGAGKRAPVNLAETKAFDRWLERELETRSERDLAYAMARTAQWLLRCDPEVAERLVLPSEEQQDPRVRARPTVSFLSKLLFRLSRRWDGASTANIPKSRTNLLDLAVATAVEVCNDADISVSTKRLALARALLKQAHELTRGRLGVVWLVRAHVEWFKGDEGRVRGLLESAEECEDSATIHAHVFQNQALLVAERELGGSSITLLHHALACAPASRHLALFRGNLVCYYAALGRFDAMDREILCIERLGQLAWIRSRLVPNRVEAYMQYMASRHSLKLQRVASAVRRCVGAIHGI